MPISRYEIRNEYSLADPELYRAADKDDPEALLEGVAMAGLVGVLRQLGDLAEFAAEIFHNLHEEVLATAGRGHSLTIRVQQLETEIPSIERAFLSQTDHSSFFYHAGVDWHPNLRLDQNLVTQGDLPRFIMDSYEECRAPPRLFLLDKFDVAGAGACLKRYTDPSFFKVEMSGADVQTEKKTRKVKKKGPRWRNGETPEVLPTSHAKLHQLFLEEQVENGVSKPFRRAKLRRRLNGFPFDLKTGKSYMEKILKSPSPDHKIAVNSSPLMSATNNQEYGFEIFEVRPVSPDRVSRGRNRSPPSPDEEETMLNPSMYEPLEPPIDDNICREPNLYPTIATDAISSTPNKVTDEVDVAADAESTREGSSNGYQSDDVASEIDKYVDAPSTMESNMDGDSELKMKSDIASSHMNSESLISDADEEYLHIRSSDSQSTGDSTISDEGNNSSIKEMASFSSDSPSTSVENSKAHDFSAEGFQCADIPVNDIVDASSYQKTVDEDFHVDHHSKPVVSDDACTEIDAITNRRSEFEQSTSRLCSNRSLPTLAHSDSEVGGKNMLKAPESDEMISTLDAKAKKTNRVIDPPCSTSVCAFESQSEDDTPRSSAGEHLVDEPNGESVPCLSTVPDMYSHTADSSVKKSSNSFHYDESDGEDRNLIDDIASTSDVLNVLSTNGNPETISSGNLIPGKLEDELPAVPENSPSDSAVTAHNGGNIASSISKEDNLVGAVDDEDSTGSTDSPNHFPCIKEVSLGKKLDETSSVNTQTINVEDSNSNSSVDNQIISENLKLLHIENSPDRPMEGLDAHEEVVIPEEGRTVSETLAVGTPEHCDAVGLQNTGITYHVLRNDSEALKSSCSTPEDLEEPAGTADTVEMDGMLLCSSSSCQEVNKIPGSAALELANEVRVLLENPDSEADKSNARDMASAMPAVSDNVFHNKLVEEHHNDFEDSAVDELENDENCPSESHGISGPVAEVGPTKASASGFETDRPKSEVSGISPESHVDLEVDHGLELVHAATIQSPVEQCGIDREQELFNRSGPGNHGPDALSLPVDYEIVDCQGPQSFPELPRPSNLEIDVPGYPKDPLGSIFPPGNPFTETSQINLADLPPLPPLPPVQWRMGKFQDALSSTEGEEMKQRELFPRMIFPPAVPSDDVNFSPPTTSTDDVGPVPLTVSSNDISSSLEEMKKSPIANAFETASKEEENVQNSCSNLEANTLHETTDRPLEMENKQQQTAIHSLLEEIKHTLIENASGTASKEDDVPNSCSNLEANTLHETTDLPPKIQNKQQQMVITSLVEEMKNHPIKNASETASKEDNGQNSCSNLEANILHETTDLPPKIENKPLQIVMPMSEGEFASPAEEDGAENGSRTVKLARPHNPLVNDVAILDKSKLRKVTERVRPEIQKVDERDSLLEQIRTKSFNLRPAISSKPPSIRAPNTNLRVAAILEKANAIRQALADSDEDDSDSWSDS